MTHWGWSADRQAKGPMGVSWLRPFSAAVPWLTILLLLLMLYFLSGTFTAREGVLFELPAAEMNEGAETQLVALVMPMSREQAMRETLVFFDDARFILNDEASERAFAEQLTDRAAKIGEKTLLVLTDRRIACGELMRLAMLAKKSGIDRILFAERKERESE